MTSELCLTTCAKRSISSVVRSAIDSARWRKFVCRQIALAISALSKEPMMKLSNGEILSILSVTEASLLISNSRSLP